jgi:hypothetical protein
MIRRIAHTALIPLLALSGLAWSPAGAQEDALSAQIARRYYFVQVNDRCHLLTAAATTALKAGFVEARNAALRAGRDMTALAPVLDGARDAAAAAACDAPQVTSEMGNAQNALRTYQVQMRLDLPGSRAQWTGVRTDQDAAEWRLVQYQNTSQADFAFGLYGTLAQNALSVTAHFADGSKPYAARLLVRNPDVWATGVIDRTALGLTSQRPTGFGDISALSFPAYNETDVSALMKPVVKVNFAGFALGGRYVGAQAPVDAQRFDFPKAAIMAMARLDPREDVVIAFDGDKGPVYARFEVGDFIPGVAYLSLPSPYTHGQL